MGGELNKCCVYVPKPQAQAFQLPVHISYFLQNYKRQTPKKGFVSFKNDITNNLGPQKPVGLSF